MKTLKLTIASFFGLLFFSFGTATFAQTPSIEQITVTPTYPNFFSSNISGTNIAADSLAGDLVMPWCRPCNIGDERDLSLTRLHFTRNSPLVVDGKSYHPLTGEMLLDFAPEPITLRMAGSTRGRKYFRHALTDVTFNFWEGNSQDPRGKVIFTQKLKMNCSVRFENYRKYNYPGATSNKYDTRSIMYNCVAVESE